MAARTTLPGSAGTGDNTGDIWTTTAIDKLPGGLAAYSTVSTADINITSLTTIASVSYTALASRMYVYQAFLGVQSATSGDIARITLTDGTARNITEFYIPSAGSDVPICLMSPPVTPSAGSVTVSLNGQMSSGSGAVMVNQSGNPSPSRVVLLVLELAPSF